MAGRDCYAVLQEAQEVRAEDFWFRWPLGPWCYNRSKALELRRRPGARSRWRWGKHHYLHVCALSCFSPVRLFATPPGSSLHEILQARILGRVVVPSSRQSSRPRDQNCVSHISCVGRQVSSPLASPGKSSLTKTQWQKSQEHPHLTDEETRFQKVKWLVALMVQRWLVMEKLKVGPHRPPRFELLPLCLRPRKNKEHKSGYLGGWLPVSKGPRAFSRRSWGYIRGHHWDWGHSN